ncbi:cob(I)yrinic acid a,c-diamide adenosyltransferase [Candidatus Curtissbacteria bacterium]|nr:cob(I)yrinic acid a,c-diamide adenosyltransferase [Candidatus Curtissbacteria bacterium]
MKIYTKTGDQGTTSLFGGKRVDKNSLRVEAYGKVDELNSYLGVILTGEESRDISSKLQRIQLELFTLATDLATPSDVKIKVPRISKRDVTRLEKEIDDWEKNLPKLRNFIVPGGSKIGAMLHLARTQARCLERIVVSLDRTDRLNGNILPYINRLSDWFFVFARRTNLEAKQPEKIWQGRS